MSDFESIKVAVLCGEALLAEGLKFTIERAGLEVVDIENGAHVAVTDYDTALIMLSAPLARLPRPMPAVLILSNRSGCGEIRHAMAAGARGYLTSDCSVSEPIAAIRTVYKGLHYLGTAAAGKLAEDIGSELLTGRELDVLRLVAKGFSNKAIARALDIAVGTVKSHVKAILQKLDTSTRTGAAAVAERRGLLNLPTGNSSVAVCTPRHRSSFAMGERFAHSM